MFELSIVVCVFNEKDTLPRVLQELVDLRMDAEILVVDDGSWDQSHAVAQRFCSLYPGVRLFKHSKRLGKGAALKEAIAHAEGRYLAVQDADLEYETADLPIFLQEMKKKNLDVLFGSRFLQDNPTHYPLYYYGNQWVSAWITRLSGCRFTDAYTGRKFFKTDLLRSWNLRSKGFDIEAELSIKTGLGFSQKGLRYAELPIRYHPRTKKEGKKIRSWDGLKAFSASWRFRNS